jgi:hypothetical protein
MADIDIDREVTELGSSFSNVQQKKLSKMQQLWKEAFEHKVIQRKFQMFVLGYMLEMIGKYMRFISLRFPIKILVVVQQQQRSILV